MLCWSGVFGCKMLNLPRGPSGNDSREVFYVCVSPLGVDLTDENLPWSSTAFLFYLTVFLKNIYSAFPQRPLLVTNWKVVHTLGNRLRYTLWLSRQKTLIARRGWRQLSSVRKQRPTPLPTKIFFFFLVRGNLHSLLPLCPCRFSAGVPDPVQSGGMRQDSQSSGGKGREGDLNFPLPRYGYAHKDKIQLHSSAVQSTLGLVRLVKTSFICGAFLLAY